MEDGDEKGDERAELAWAALSSRLEPLVEACERASRPSTRRLALAQLEAAMHAADPESIDAALLERLKALPLSSATLQASELLMPAHAVLVPFVVTRGGTRRAIVRAIVVSPTRHERPPGFALGDTAERAVRAAIALAHEDAPPTDRLSHLHVVPVQPMAFVDTTVDGPSLAAGAYLSARALLSARRTRREFVVTGALVGRALAGVDGVPEKLAAARARGLTLLAPPENAAENTSGGEPGLEGIVDVDELVARALVPGAVDADLDAAIEKLHRRSHKAWNGYQWPMVREEAARVAFQTPPRRPDLRVDVLALLAGAERHLGRTRESLAAIAEAEAIAASDEGKLAVPDEPLIRLARQKAMTLTRTRRLDEAAREAEASVAIARRARLRGSLISSLGTAGLVAMAASRSEDALSWLEEALAVGERQRPHDLARSRAYLVEALGALGRAEEAERQYQLALREAEADPHPRHGGKIEWVRTSYAKALLLLGEHARVIEVLDDPSVETAILEHPLPGLVARRCRGVALLRSSAPAERRRGRALLEASTRAYPLLEPFLEALAHANAVLSYQDRAAEGEAVDDAAIEASLEAIARVLGAPEAIERLRALTEKRARLDALVALSAQLTRL